MFMKPNVTRYLDFEYMNRTILWNILSVINYFLIKNLLF